MFISEGIQDRLDKIKTVPYRIRRIWERLCRAISGARLGWNDADWDPEYLLLILKWKLNHMVKYFEACEIKHVGMENDIRDMRIALILIQRLLDDKYIEQYEPSEERGFIDEITLTRTLGQHQKAYRQERQDYEYLFNLIGNKLQRWWV